MKNHEKTTVKPTPNHASPEKLNSADVGFQIQNPHQLTSFRQVSTLLSPKLFLLFDILMMFIHQLELKRFRRR
jgi:hypothetical protein